MFRHDDMALRKEVCGRMSAIVYVTIMLAVISVCTLVSVPPLFFRKCPACGVRNFLEAHTCKGCKAPLPDDDGQDTTSCGRHGGGC